MFQHRRGSFGRRISAFTLGFACLAATACAFGQAAPRALVEMAALASPAPERITAGSAWQLAEAVAAATPDSELLVGNGDSMLPLYPDRTLLIVQHASMTTLRPGMTVVFVNDEGRAVAHTLREKTPRGWVAQGVGNATADRTLVRARNYIGVVVRAFAPSAESAIAAASAPSEPASAGE